VAGTDATAMGYALRLQNGVAEVREGGVWKSEMAFGAGDTLRIAADNGTVTYAKNGGVFYTSGTRAGSALRVNALLFDAGATIGSAVVRSGSPASVPSSGSSSNSTSTANRAVPRSPSADPSQTSRTPRRSPRPGGQ